MGRALIGVVGLALSAFATLLGGARAEATDPLAAANVRLDGAGPGDNAGFRVASAGDVNGDGRLDVLVGAPGADGNGREDSGSVYVVFGQPAPATIELSALGARGYRIDGAEARDNAGAAVANAGDVDGDGRPDALVGAPFADVGGRDFSGSAYVVFGRAEATTVDLARLGGRGYRIAGVGSERAGWSVASAGDVDRDGRPDALVGAPLASRNGRSYSGSAYVVYGSSSLATVDLGAPGTRGYRVDGVQGEHLGWSVAGTGDVDGDGRADAVLGALDAGRNGRDFSGSAYVVPGRPDAGDLDLGAPGVPGFRIDGAAAGDNAGAAVAGAGDVNGDGRPDILVGALNADVAGRASSGAAYVVFGTLARSPIDLARLGRQGYRIAGSATGDSAGGSVAAAGDVDGDGRTDLLVGASAADSARGADAGAVYVVFGQRATASIDLCAPAGKALRVDGGADGNRAGSSVAGAGVVDPEGRTEIVIGAPAMSPGGNVQAGSVYVVSVTARAVDPGSGVIRRAPPKRGAARCDVRPLPPSG